MIYQSYIFKNSLFNWLSTTFILLILIWFSKAISFLNLVTENGINIKDFFYLFILILPWIMIYILPIAFLGSSILTLNKLNNLSEIIIFKNCGLTNLKIARPLIYLGLVISIISYFLSLYLMPLANKKLKISKNIIKDNYTNISFTPQTFENFNNISIYSSSRENNQMSGLFIHDNNNKQYSLTLTAKTGKLIVNDDQVYLKLNNGTLQKFTYDDKKTETLNFDSYIFNLNNNNLEFYKYKWKANERYLSELIIYNLNDSPEDIKIYKAEFHKRINEPLLSLVFALITSSLILNMKVSRKNNIFSLIYIFLFNIIYSVILIFSFRLNEKFENLYFLPYLINLFFISFSFWHLKIKYLFKK
jgi:lipopolysaccharide export system permease protein